MDMPETDDRLIIPLSHQWSFRSKFHKGESIVDLPHCWNERDTFQLGVRYQQGCGSYTRSFEMSEAMMARPGAHWILRSEGFYGTGILRANGRRVCRVDGQYLGLSQEVTRFLHAGRVNTFEVSLSNAYKRYVLPGKKNPDFLLHGGLAGRVWLERRPEVHVVDRSLYAACSDALGARPMVSVSLSIRNASRTTVQGCSIRTSLYSPTGALVGMANSDPLALGAGKTHDLRVALAVDDPDLWDLNQPSLYRAVCELQRDGVATDRASTSFGIRDVVFDGEKGFFLNGNRIYLQGVNRHESIPGFGNAMPPSLHREDAQQIRDLGLNLVRLSHYPQHPAFLDACDALGVLVYAEIASWKSVRPGPWARAAYRQLRDMIQRDRNHPSIVLWGFGNESRSRLAFRKMGRIVQELDPTRATIYAENHLHRGSRWRTLKQTDVLGVNYELDRLDDAHALSRNGSVLISEVSNCAYTTRGDEEAELKQIAAFERDAALLRDRPFVAGYALWCYADYASQRRGRCRRQPGLVDAWRTPKMSASYMQAGLAKELFLHAYGDWGLNTEGSTRNIHLFSNAERLILRVKGKILADVEAKQYTLVTVPFYPEELQIVARGGDEDRLVSLIPYGTAVGIVLEPDRQVGNASKRETVGVRVRVVDAAGETVSDHHDEVCLSAEGPGRIRFFSQRDSVEIHAGVGRFFVTGTGASCPVTLRATQNTLSAGVAVVEYTDG